MVSGSALGELGPIVHIRGRLMWGRLEVPSGGMSRKRSWLQALWGVFEASFPRDVVEARSRGVCTRFLAVLPALPMRRTISSLFWLRALKTLMVSICRCVNHYRVLARVEYSSGYWRLTVDAPSELDTFSCASGRQQSKATASPRVFVRTNGWGARSAR